MALFCKLDCLGPVVRPRRHRRHRRRRPCFRRAWRPGGGLPSAGEEIPHACACQESHSGHSRVPRVCERRCRNWATLGWAILSSGNGLPLLPTYRCPFGRLIMDTAHHLRDRVFNRTPRPLHGAQRRGRRVSVAQRDVGPGHGHGAMLFYRGAEAPRPSEILPSPSTMSVLVRNFRDVLPPAHPRLGILQSGQPAVSQSPLARGIQEVES